MWLLNQCQPAMQSCSIPRVWWKLCGAVSPRGLSISQADTVQWSVCCCCFPQTQSLVSCRTMGCVLIKLWLLEVKWELVADYLWLPFFVVWRKDRYGDLQ